MDVVTVLVAGMENKAVGNVNLDGVESDYSGSSGGDGGVISRGSGGGSSGGGGGGGSSKLLLCY